MRLSTDGDPFEQHYWGAFVAELFPSYEAFWLAAVVPVTGRDTDRRDIHFRSQQELGEARDEEVAVAQLHYTTLLHLGRVYDLLHPPAPPVLPIFPPPGWALEPGPGSATITSASATSSETTTCPADAALSEGPWESKPDFDMHAFTEAFVRLAAASDVADELMQRRASPRRYDTWDEAQGKEARWAWRQAHGDPLRAIRDYRNRLVHGRVVPRLLGPRSLYPRLDKVSDHRDWRRITDPALQTRAHQDFEEGGAIVSGAWDETVAYVETNWRNHLLADS